MALEPIFNAVGLIQAYLGGRVPEKDIPAVREALDVFCKGSIEDGDINHISKEQMFAVQDLLVTSDFNTYRSSVQLLELGAQSIKQVDDPEVFYKHYEDDFIVKNQQLASIVNQEVEKLEEETKCSRGFSDYPKMWKLSRILPEKFAELMVNYSETRLQELAAAAKQVLPPEAQEPEKTSRIVLQITNPNGSKQTVQATDKVLNLIAEHLQQQQR
jgi:hypothetical protein